MLTRARALAAAGISAAPAISAISNSVTAKLTLEQSWNNFLNQYGISATGEVDYTKLLTRTVGPAVAGYVFYKATGFASKRFSRALKF